MLTSIKNKSVGALQIFFNKLCQSYDFNYKLNCKLSKQMWFVLCLFLASHPGPGGGPNNFSTMFCNVDGPLNSLSTSKDGSQVVVAGRNGMLQFICVSQCIICCI